MQEKVPPKVSVLIPTYNGGIQFRNTLEAVLQQKTTFTFEIIIIDSSSTDGSDQYCQRLSLEHPSIRLFSIPKESFQHGKTRNYGISQSRGVFVALLTQDAMPANEYWLSSLITPMIDDPSIVGIFGKHIPYNDVDIFEKQSILNQFAQFGDGLVPFKLTDENKQKFHEDATYRGFLCYYSDNNSALRKSIWHKIPYPEVAFGEDQLWAKAIISKGYTKAYTSLAIVYHSHRFPLIEYTHRFKEEGKALYEAHGWRICSNSIGLPRQIVYLVSIDLIALKKVPCVLTKPYWLLYSIAKNTAKAIGLFIGYKIGSRKKNDIEHVKSI